jgi:hypothetical protein
VQFRQQHDTTSCIALAGQRSSGGVVSLTRAA